ncbi:DUF2956 domain-containing protein [Vibrio litoralis]|uniref:DUF2956 domain-containing protein n=2 Tax=Bacteria TaxID=2 RepID=UPI0004155788|nr:DUF2956 domain-containing protein [Vibrio litoralis]
MKPNKKSISPETQQEAFSVAKSTQKPGQTKEQTKLIAQGIEKGITLYKKQHKEKLREADKLRKKQSRNSHQPQTESNVESPVSDTKPSNQPMLPWALLVLSWVGFATYLLLQQ